MTPEEYCRSLAAPSGSSFHYSVLFLPAEKRSALTCLFAFYREIKEGSEECSDPALGQIKLNWWRQELASAWSGRAQHPATQALFPAAARFDLAREHLAALIDAVESSLFKNRHADFPSLQDYCSRTAGLVEQLAARILGLDDPVSLQHAKDLGMAFGFTHVILNLRHDAMRNRILLPQDQLARTGVAEGDILKLRETENLKKLIEFAIDKAENCYNRATSKFSAAERKALRARLALAAISRSQLREIREDGCCILRRRVELTPLSKLWLAWTTWVGG